MSTSMACGKLQSWTQNLITKKYSSRSTENSAASTQLRETGNTADETKCWLNEGGILYLLRKYWQFASGIFVLLGPTFISYITIITKIGQKRNSTPNRKVLLIQNICYLVPLSNKPNFPSSYISFTNKPFLLAISMDTPASGELNIWISQCIVRKSAKKYLTNNELRKKFHSK